MIKQALGQVPSRREESMNTAGAHRIIEVGVLDTIERALTSVSADPGLKARAAAAYRELLRDLEPLTLLLNEAARVIQGEAAASARFERLLERVADSAEPRSRLIAPIMHDEARIGEDGRSVDVEALMSVAVAVGTLQVDEDRFGFLFDGLQSLADSVAALQDFNDAAVSLIARGNPAPMRTLSWRPPARRLRKPKPVGKPKPKRSKRPIGKRKIKDTHHAWMSCFRGAASRARAESGQAPTFTVTSIAPIDACPGEQVVIRGTNFGSNLGTVGFHTASGSASDYLAVGPDSWSNDAIVVTVPDWARQGPLQIHAIDHVFEECHRKWPVYRLPDPTGPQNNLFLGGLPDIFDLTVNGRNAKPFALPDSDAVVAWITTSGTLSVDIRNDDNPAEDHWTGGPLDGGMGSVAWRTNSVGAPTRYVVAVTVTNRCGSFTRELPVFVTVPAVVKIEGVEVTQGVQVFSLTGGARNTLPTVSDKDTIVRLYVSADRGGWFSNKLAHVTASLGVGGTSGFAPINKAPPGKASGGDPYLDIAGLGAIDREKTDASFNFRIPAALCTGTKSCVVAVMGSDELGPIFLNQRFMWTWQPKKALPVRYVRVSYQGATPSPADAAFTVERAFDLLPSPPLDIGPAWLATWNTGEDLTTDDGKAALLSHLLDQHNCTFSEWLFPWEDDCPDDDGAYWVAVIAASVGGRTRTGERTGWASSFAFDRVTAAHEIGHMLCLRHVNQGCAGSNPAKSNTCGGGSKGYDSLPFGGQVQDVAFDPYNNAVRGSPRFDMMSYACTRWISATNWNRLFSSI
jgi:hypothetical protein